MTCSNCGAPTTVDTGPAVCEYCGYQIELPIDAEVISGLDDDLAHVERWWEEASRPYVSIDRHGVRHPPPEKNAIYVVMMALGGVLGMAAFFAGSQADLGFAGMAGFFLFPILISLPAALMNECAEKKFKKYQELEKERQVRRQTIIERHARLSS